MDFNRLLQIEEEQVQKMCEDIIALKPDLVFTEKGVSGRYFLNTVTVALFMSLHSRSDRSCTALLGEAQYHCHSTSKKDGQ